MQSVFKEWKVLLYPYLSCCVCFFMLFETSSKTPSFHQTNSLCEPVALSGNEPKHSGNKKSHKSLIEKSRQIFALYYLLPLVNITSLVFPALFIESLYRHIHTTTKAFPFALSAWTTFCFGGGQTKCDFPFRYLICQMKVATPSNRAGVI
jgi:hypothetical protein